MIEVSFFSALLGGLLTFFAPCTLPLIPAYVGFLGGAIGEANEAEKRNLRKRMMRNAVLFVLGFSLIFIFVGLISGTLGKAYARHQVLLSQVSGVIIFFFGISMLGLIPIPNLFTKLFARRRLPKILIPGNPYSAFLLGILFAVGLGPTCLGPILGYITLLAITTGTGLYGAYLLSVYSLGIAIPFLVVAFIYGSSFLYIERLSSMLPYLNKISGLLLMFIGIMMMMVNFGLISFWFGNTFGEEWYAGLMNYM